MVEDANQVAQVVLRPPHMCVHTWTHTQVNDCKEQSIQNASGEVGLKRRLSIKECILISERRTGVQFLEPMAGGSQPLAPRNLMPPLPSLRITLMCTYTLPTTYRQVKSLLKSSLK